jgi:hypothetical protein
LWAVGSMLPFGSSICVCPGVWPRTACAAAARTLRGRAAFSVRARLRGVGGCVADFS